MLAGFLSVLVLVGAFIVIRSGAGRRDEGGGWSKRARGWETVAGALIVAASAFPLLWLLPWTMPPTYFGDAMSHAHVARDVALRGLSHGWVDTYLGGFPFGLHYPPLGTLLLALTIRLGVPSAEATHLWGLVATLAVPLALYGSALRCGARPVFAALGASFAGWVSPYNPFVGGYEAFFTLGLFAQVLALPICIVFAGLVARGGQAWPAALGALAMAAHPQLAVATLAVVGLACAASLEKEVLVRFARGASGAMLAGIALYGQGILTLGIPFGWPPEIGWRLVGFGWARLDWWFLDGDLLDRNRVVPALTALAGAALLVLAFRARRPAARAAIVAFTATIVLSGIGPVLSRFEPLGPALLSVVQPLRVLALVPAIGGALVVVALEESAPLLERALGRLGRLRASKLVGWCAALVVLVVLATAFPQRVRFAAEFGSALRSRSGGDCAAGPPGYRRDTVGGFVGRLKKGRLWFRDHPDDRLEPCLVFDGIPLESGMPIAMSGGGPGAHVGLHWAAFHRLEPERAGSDRRAEALGVRHALLAGAEPEGWSVSRRSGGVALYSHARPTDLVGVGCIVERWRGSDDELRKRLVADLKTPTGGDRLLDPNRLVVLEPSTGALAVRAVEPGPCDPSGARVETRPREPGAFEAFVESAAPVDVVVRAAAFPTWAVSVDGKPAPRVEMVAPGFFSTRVPAGRHHVVAVVSPMPGYAFSIVLGMLAVAVASLVSRARLRRAGEVIRALVRRDATGT